MGFIREIRALRRYGRLPRSQRRMTFYSEGPADWPHLEPLIAELIKTHAQPLSYITSSSDDPGLKLPAPLVAAFDVGTGIARTILFRMMDADLAVMTMPDLDFYHLRRSVHSVHYVYVFHAINSAHMIYQRHAFDAYDTIFCAGPHHVQELRELERLNRLKPRHLIEHGYGRLDRLLQDGPDTRNCGANMQLTVLVAPSWGPSSIVETCGAGLVDILLRSGVRVILRAHPMTRRDRSGRYDALVSQFSSHPAFEVDNDITSHDSLTAADVLVTDWSGIAFEFAFAHCKPILFIDLPPKTRNPDFLTVGVPPLEQRLRPLLGDILAPDKLDHLPEKIAALTRRPHERRRLEELRDKTVFNVRDSAKAGAEALLKLLHFRG